MNIIKDKSLQQQQDYIQALKLFEELLLKIVKYC